MSKYISRLKAMKRAWNLEKYPNLPAHAIPEPKYSTKDTNGLTKCIQDLVNLSGGAIFRINSQGQYDAKLKRWRKSGSDPGTPDLMGAAPNGQFLGVEVKFGRDTLSDKQTRTINRINEAGGVVFVARDFDSFYEWFHHYYFPGE